jgi:hypothetical protein
VTLLERLEAVEGGPFPPGAIGTCWHRNPDGPEAATRIRQLEAENGALREILTFDCTAFPAMEAKAIEWANKISGLKGQPHHHPDPIGILELCEDIAKSALNELRLRALLADRASEGRR